ncbi:hypothetical protein BOTBODRAFT_60394 [Botryobasidium botryosum FD-172 SS1]|uniref:Mitochondrial import inner membrane translocase subunit TIM50 n=1 Tax=Botryobasidium botryosum (strain FD-172 SS1) TaxID=930990 RepID=A0A067M5J4_BOTB1|nr:hypothetical protein BOTBODRAFT_60394 [Botryobasidium botryosum FD-172 SS1]
MARYKRRLGQTTSAQDSTQPTIHHTRSHRGQQKRNGRPRSQSRPKPYSEPSRQGPQSQRPYVQYEGYPTNESHGSDAHGEQSHPHYVDCTPWFDRENHTSWAGGEGFSSFCYSSHNYNTSTDGYSNTEYYPSPPGLQQYSYMPPIFNGYGTTYFGGQDGGTSIYSPRPVHMALPETLPQPPEPPREQSISPTFVLRSPSPTYISRSEEPSTKLDTPLTKLLILDLNGTLVIRSPRRKGPKGLGPGRRNIYPRPFLATFAKYLFHPETALDVMVWSSAQPHSVEDMVELGFGHYRDGLKAVWARDSFGLTPAEYATEAQTVKDLDIVWSRLPQPPPPQPEYSSLNTILLDDSAIKAHLQPYNHVIVRDYDNENDGPIKDFREDLGDKSLDYMLIAVIGVLDEVTKQSSVCGWCYADGLWAGLEPQTTPLEDERPLLWYEHEPTYEHWVQKGKEVIARLGLNNSALSGDSDH